ncbi:MAG TPA: nucleotidyltransferase domain-containing protein [Candidatus Paceibacterota bacterium]|nr:nucleotidyltransferase domain-containing protein [Candidatus Paceibacterota bacterium]
MVKKKTKLKFVKEKVVSIDLKTDRDIGMDFAVKVYRKFDKIVKAIVLFGSSAKKSAVSTSDIDIVIIVDDASIQWDQELIAWYREELGKIVEKNPYKKELHINTIKLTTWWDDLIKGDAVLLNILRYGEALIDIGGFFNPLKALLIQGRIKLTPEAVYIALQRSPEHIRRSKLAEISAVEGLYWSMVDSAQAALMSIKLQPPSPEHIPLLLKENFVDNNQLDIKYVSYFRDLYIFYKKIIHGDINDLDGADLEMWQKRTEEFLSVMVNLVRDSIE